MRADFRYDHSHATVARLFRDSDRWFDQNGLTGPGLSADMDQNDLVDPDDLFIYLDFWFAEMGSCQT
jgi:hypothetical protein